MSKSLLSTTRSRILKDMSARQIASGIVLVACFAFLGYKAYDSWDAVKTFDWQIRYLFLIPSFLLFLVQLAVIVWGWQSIMDILTQRIPFLDHLRIYSYTNLLRRIPAGFIWLVTGRVVAYKERQVPARVSALGSFLEFLLAVLAGLPLAALAATGLGLLSPVAGILLTVVALALELSVIHPTVLQKLILLVRRHSLEIELTYRSTLTWALIYTAVWLISGTGLYLVACLFTQMSIDWLPTMIGVWVLASLVAYLTLLSPSGLGVKELSLTLLLSIVLPDPLPLLIALAVRVIWTVYDLAIGMIAWAL